MKRGSTVHNVFVLLRSCGIAEARVRCSHGPLALSRTMPRKRRTVWGNWKTLSFSLFIKRSKVSLPLFYFPSLFFCHWEELTFCNICVRLIRLCFLCFQVGAGWIAKCEYCVFLLRKCLYASMIFMSPEVHQYSMCVMFYFTMTSLSVCVCPCVQCAGSELRAALWDKRTNTWLPRLSGTSGTKSVILQTPPSLRQYKVSNTLTSGACGWLVPDCFNLGGDSKKAELTKTQTAPDNNVDARLRIVSICILINTLDLITHTQPLVFGRSLTSCELFPSIWTNREKKYWNTSNIERDDNWNGCKLNQKELDLNGWLDLPLSCHAWVCTDGRSTQ